MRLNEAGFMVRTWWQKVASKFPSVRTDKYIIMPNHFHGIVNITGAAPRGRPIPANVNDTSEQFHNKSGEPRGKSGQPRGKSGQPDGESGQPHGESGQPRGESGQPDGESGQPRGESGQPHGVAPTVGDIVNWFKTMTTNQYIRGVKRNRWSPFRGKLWQRNYYERIIRNEEELNHVRQYIAENPLNWQTDKENPDVTSSLQIM